MTKAADGITPLKKACLPHSNATSKPAHPFLTTPFGRVTCVFGSHMALH